ncbi:MAG: sensor histidine kinase [Saprospirales bacterium]|nr:MAG: sensor histidine kinase [Saprospirales bacterium]
MYKNITPHQITILSALAISSILLVIYLLFSIGSLVQFNWIVLALIAIGTFAVSYFVNIFFLEKYIYRKVKLIYKIIHQAKVSTPEEREIKLNEDIIDKVEDEVEKWMEDQRKEIQSLKNLEKYRRNFLGNISHELKTPIFSIQGYIHTLLDGGLYDEKINRDYLIRAANNVERLQTIVEDLEIIARLENETMVLDIQTFDIKTLAIEVIEDLEMTAKALNINVALKEGADKSFPVRADRENIRQVLTNLVVNSIKYGKEGGRTKIGFYDMSDYILVEVSDNGIGIESKHLNHVFDRFYRVDKSRSRDQGGSGLGLSIVKHIIEAHKQTITVRSTVGLGSTFGFTLARGSAYDS